MARKKARGAYGAGSYKKLGERRHRVQWRDITGVRRTETFQDEITARAKLSDYMNDATQGRHSVVGNERGTALSIHFKAWSEARTNETIYDDRKRWENHWEPLIGHLGPNQVTVGVLKRHLVALRKKNLSKASVKLCVALLSTLYTDLVEEGAARQNPARMLSKKTRREYLKSDHDPKLVPYVRDPQDLGRIYQHLLTLNAHIATAYAIGSLAGLRTGEVRALQWSAIDLETRTITVSEQVQSRKGVPREQWSPTGTKSLKDGETRIVPIVDALYPILAERQRATGGLGLVCPPKGVGKMKAGSGQRFLDEHTLGKYLRLALTKLGIEEMIWYQGTRHTFASQWVLHGGSLEKLREMMGHSTVMVTERYAHLVPGRFTEADRGRIQIDMTAPLPQEKETPALPAAN